MTQSLDRKVVDLTTKNMRNYDSAPASVKELGKRGFNRTRAKYVSLKGAVFEDLTVKSVFLVYRWSDTNNAYRPGEFEVSCACATCCSPHLIESVKVAWHKLTE